ncbi:MAG: hypothetical protein LBJ86_02685 [Spirochaetaceae bacterium]|jgi:hypothetical protein|nr:hypothetical protein [Spirochaetaceae bacterium]
MPLAWNEIKTRAAAFVLDWKDKAAAAREEADAQTFENGFFYIFGVSRAKVAIFEKKVRLKDSGDFSGGLFGDSTGSAASGYIDLFWKGHIIIEMKSPGKDLNAAYEQARAYAASLPSSDLPKGILVCDFVNFHYYDLDDDAKQYRFTLSELPQYVELFGFLAGYANVEYKKFDPVNIEAAENMGRLHDRLKDIGYSGHQLEIYLVRLLFCLFSDDGGIFPHDHFIKYIIERANPDGSDLAMHLEKIFETLDKPPEKRLKNIDEQLNRFPFIDGRLFEERLDTADFDSAMRDTLIDCCTLDWSKISPAIFGAMFQSVMDDERRHDIGAHYTSEENILKVIHPLFLDGLWAEFEKIKSLVSNIRVERLRQFHDRLSKLKFLDPACGCGNFLVISYRELRLLEMELVKELLAGGGMELDLDMLLKVNVDQFYGIEIEEFPAQVAQTALWLMDHQMNMLVSENFGRYYIRIPLFVSPSIRCDNALTLDWESVVPKDKLSYIMGNPPFLGYSVMNSRQKSELERVFENMKKCGTLDYVTAWYKTAARYMSKTRIEAAFVSTNSICQGEQVPVLWPELMNKHLVKINFAHQTFKWSNEARGKAAVYCVIVGFSLFDRSEKKLYHYAEVTSEPAAIIVSQINAYLIDAPVIFLEKRLFSICDVPEMNLGSTPNDDGNFFLTTDERKELIAKEKSLSKLIRPFMGAYEFINNIPRFCFWLDGVSPEKYVNVKEIQRRLKKISEYRANSRRKITVKYADMPSLFTEIRQPYSDYILIPRHSSENRKYIPIGFIKKNIIAGDSTSIIPNATLYHFGVLISQMHMAWTRYVCGRLKSDYRYSGTIVYNNFPWPKPTDKQRQSVEAAAQSVLDARAAFPESSLAVLYNPQTMPPALVKAHRKLDKTVERSYGRAFDDDSQRVAYLFELYQEYCSELIVTAQKRGKGRKL